MQQHAAGTELVLRLDGTPMLEQVALEGSRPGVDVSCRAPRVHEAWRRSSRGVFTTCPMCDRDSIGDRSFSHH
jgi:hypothetical protein